MIEFGKFVFPQLTEGPQPIVNNLHFFRVERIVNFAPALVLCDKLTFRKYFNVLGYGLSGGVKMFCQCVGRHGIQCNKTEDSSSRRIGYRLKYISSHSSEYISNCLVANV